MGGRPEQETERMWEVKLVKDKERNDRAGKEDKS